MRTCRTTSGGRSTTSKRRSATNSRRQPPEQPVTFFLDRSLGRHVVARALTEAGATVVVHDDEFPQTTRDEEWLLEVGRRGWFVISKDSRIRHSTLAKQAIVQARVGAFIVAGRGPQLKGEELASLLVGHLRRMTGLARSRARPFIATVTRSRVEVLR